MLLPPRVLFVDSTQLSAIDTRLSFEVQPPTKGPLVIRASEPWESAGVAAYNAVVRGDASRPHRMYYDCIESTNATTSLRRICLAESLDGLQWTKPSLGVFLLNGSASNNIICEDSGVSVFIDTKPGVPDSARWKMVTSGVDGGSAYSSADGLHWTRLPFKHLSARDDTKPTAGFDPALGKYVVYLRNRRDGDSATATRAIGR